MVVRQCKLNQLVVDTTICISQIKPSNGEKIY
jgi:hypothetical protein